MTKVVLAFDSFKGCLSAAEACDAAERGILSALPACQVVKLPMSDGGEGLVDCLASALPLRMVTVNVQGPMGHRVDARYALSADGTTAYIEMAAASGLTLVPPAERNPLLATTYGVGQMLLDAVRRGCRRVVMGLGGSATCDGGQGMVDALLPYLPLPLEVTVASDVTNPLYGPTGAAYVFAPQKGATPQQVEELDQRLREVARAAEAAGYASPLLHEHPGAGAAGGLGYALMAYLHAELCPGIELVLNTLGFDRCLQDASLVITGEGSTDRQTLMGKVPWGILQRAKAHRVPVVVMSGSIRDRELLQQGGFTQLHCINEGDPRPLSELLRPEVARANLTRCASQIVQ